MLLAGIYVARRGWLRLSSMSSSKPMNASSCSDGCGGCGTAQAKSAPPRVPVQISISRK